MIAPVNRQSTERWKEDSDSSVDYYNEWFLRFAPPSFRRARAEAAEKVSAAFSWTDDCRRLDAATVAQHPALLAVARQLTCPPLARDRLAGLAKVERSFVQWCEEADETATVPARHSGKLAAVLGVLSKMLDTDIMPWLAEGASGPTAQQRNRSALVIADRLCGALSNPILRNAQEKRQLDALSGWLSARGYRKTSPHGHEEMHPGDFAIHLDMAGRVADDSERTVNIPVDLAVVPLNATPGALPILFEAKSAGDYTNVNKRRKEEAQKFAQLQRQHGADVSFVLFLCGYFDPGYLGYEAAEGIDWVWEHRIGDLEKLGL